MEEEKIEIVDYQTEVEKFIEMINEDLLKEVVRKFNYKQRSEYRLSELKFILIPDKDTTIDAAKLDLVAFGSSGCLDKKLCSSWVVNERLPVTDDVFDMIANIMRYGLKQIYQEGQVISDGAYL